MGCLTKILNSVNYGDCFKSSIGTEYFDTDVYRCIDLGLHATHTHKVWLQTWLYPKITILVNFFLLNVNYDKSIIGLHFLLTPFILAKFPKDQKSITMSSINY